MVLYSINIDYTTGHSNHSERIFQEVGMNWKDIEKAKKSLWCIGDHHKAVKYYDDLRYEERDDFERSIASKPWYVGPIGSEYAPDGMWVHQVAVEKDDGSRFSISAFWHGHFETLHSAEVCIAAESEEKSDDMRIFF